MNAIDKPNPSAPGLCAACAPIGRCRAEDADHEFMAHNNAPGSMLARYVPLPSLDPGILDLNYDYFPANEDSHPVVARTKSNLAKLEGTSLKAFLLTGSLLDLFGGLPSWLGCQTVVKPAGDFPGYVKFAQGVTVVEAPIDLSADEVDPSVMGETVAGLSKALVYLTFPVTNPNQQRMRLAVVEAVLEANNEAIVVIDHAYRRYGDTPGLAAFAQSHERVIYVDTAAKDLFLCGARIGWLTAGASLLLQIAPHIGPYVISPVSVAQVNSLLEAPEALEALLATVIEARDILARAVATLDLPIRSGPGPWVLVNFGRQAPAVVDELWTTYRIRVQLQEGLLQGWVRISATVPCEARLIGRALADMAEAAKVTDLVEDAARRPNPGAVKRMLDAFRQIAAGEARKVLDEMKAAQDAQLISDWGPLLGRPDSKPTITYGSTVVRFPPPKD